MSKKIKFMILLIVVIIVGILLMSILVSNATEKFDSELTYNVEIAGQTTTVQKPLTEEDYDAAQQILKDRASGIALASNEQPSESVQRAIEELELIDQLLKDEIQVSTMDISDDFGLKEPASIAEENEKMGDSLESIAKKYNKLEQYNTLMNEVNKQMDNSDFTKERQQVCELFINIYNNNDLNEQDQNSIKSFLETLGFEDIPASLQSQIDSIIN
jgi:hypothetical protein